MSIISMGVPCPPKLYKYDIIHYFSHYFDILTSLFSIIQLILYYSANYYYYLASFVLLFSLFSIIQITFSIIQLIFIIIQVILYYYSGYFQLFS
jgi:hypothetical protein